MIKKTFSFIIFFIFLLCPFLIIGGVKLHLPYYILLVSSLFVCYEIIYRREINQFFFYFLVVCFFLFFWFFLVSSVFSNLDTEFIYYILCIIPVFLLSIFINDKFLYKLTEEDIVFYIFLVGTLHALIMTISFFSPTFSNALYSVIPLGEKGLEFIETNTRSPGLTGGGGDHLSIFQAFCIYCGVKYFLFSKFSIFRTIFFLISFSLLLMSIFLSARTGFIVLISLFIWDVIYSIFFKSGSFIDKFKNLFFYIFIFLFTLIIIVSTYYVLKDSTYLRFFNRAFEVFINYNQSGKFETNSTNTLMDMIIIPESTSHFFLGSGYFGRGEGFNLHSDIGYVRMLYGGGVLGMLVLFSPLLLIFLVVKKIKKTSLSLAREITLALIFTLVIANFKVVHYFGTQETFKLLLFLFTFMVLRTKNDIFYSSQRYKN